ncbi:MAG: glycosyl hydrolase, partial [Clostridiales bacterium]|nr:glycosyl hydrolase [Clostridiales bacterium]
MPNKIDGWKETITRNLTTVTESGKIKIEYDTAATAVFGLGERFCSVNHMGKQLKNEVFEKFCKQGEHTYLPLPFYHADDGHGVFVNTSEAVWFDFSKGHFSIIMEEDADYAVHFIYGSAKEIIAEFMKQTGEAILAPKWAFGVWASANRWKCQQDIEEQMDYFEKYQYPVNVVVIEAWSDEATFYAWNGSEYKVTKGNEGLRESMIIYHEPWKNPKKMIEDLHSQNLKLILWQIPALKLLDEGQSCPQHMVDCDYAVENRLVGETMDGSPYKIPRQWFIGSMIPDFANPDTREWWFEKRNYLLEMGVDGFKT